MERSTGGGTRGSGAQRGHGTGRSGARAAPLRQRWGHGGRGLMLVPPGWPWPGWRWPGWPEAPVTGGRPQWRGARTACGTWTGTAPGTPASTATSSPSAAARATSATAAATPCACSPSASSATASPSGAASAGGGCWVLSLSDGCWVLDVGCWVLDTGQWRWVLVTGTWCFSGCPCPRSWVFRGCPWVLWAPSVTDWRSGVCPPCHVPVCPAAPGPSRASPRPSCSSSPSSPPSSAASCAPAATSTSAGSTSAPPCKVGWPGGGPWGAGVCVWGAVMRWVQEGGWR